MDIISVLNTISSLNSINTISNKEIRRPKHYKTKKDPLHLDEAEFRIKYGFTKETVKYIVSLVKEDLQPELQVLAALRCWGRREVQDDCGDLHGLSQSTISRICSRVARAIAKHAYTFFKMPNMASEEAHVMQQYKQIANFPTVNGSIDCTHIKIRKMVGGLAQYFINRKGVYTLNLQAVCDAKLRFTDIVARWRGSTHDSRIFIESSLKAKFENN